MRELLAYYGLSGHYNEIREWYDGYQFGNVEVYCPWDVINYCDTLRANGNAEPQNYWANTSSNEAVKRFIRESGKGTVRREIERLVAGEIITKEIHPELTYQEMYDSIDNIWSVLYTTGYLTRRGEQTGKQFQLAIPNMEIRNIFTEQIMAFFKENVPKDGETLKAFCEALKAGNAEDVERLFGDYLRRTISIRDTFVKKQMKENFYHGILLGIIGFQDTWGISSSQKPAASNGIFDSRSSRQMDMPAYPLGSLPCGNKESGDGYSDILVEVEDEEIGIIIEVKYAQDENLEAAARKALEQIESLQYEELLREEGIDHILKYGIACHKKKCRVMIAGEKID